jgi:hypothetical protein
MGRGLASGAGLEGFPGVHFVFISSFSFSFSGFLFEFLKKFYYSDLNEFEADHLWSFENVFRN